MASLRDLPTRTGVMSIDARLRFALAIGVELIYMKLSYDTYHLPNTPFAAIEVARTPLRLIAALVLWLLMADVMFSRRPDFGSLRQASFVVGIATGLLVPLLTLHRYETTAF